MHCDLERLDFETFLRNKFNLAMKVYSGTLERISPGGLAKTQQEFC